MEDVPDWWERSVGTRAKEIWLPSDQEKSSLVLSKRLEAKPRFTLNNAIEALSKTHTSQSTLVTSDEEKTPNSLMKVRMYPTKPQVKLLNKMFGTHRALYNKLVEYSREDCRKLKTSELTAKYRPISRKQSLTDYLPEYHLEVPEGVMDSTFRDYTKALKSSTALFEALKKKDKKTSFPELKFKSKKHNSSSIELRDEKFYLCIPRVKEFEQTSSSRVCAIDPGVRSFITMYDPEGLTLGVDDANEEIFRRCLTIDRAISRKTKETSKRKRYRLNKRVYKMFQRVKAMIADMHQKISIWLSKNYKEVLLPSFKTSDMTSKQKRISGKISRAMLTWSHYKFKMMLEYKMKRSGGKMVECEEHYTTKTCSRCGRINRKITSEKVFNCASCTLTMDRDVNAARNIYLKNEHLLTRALEFGCPEMPTSRLSGALSPLGASTRNKKQKIANESCGTLLANNLTKITMGEFFTTIHAHFYQDQDISFMEYFLELTKHEDEFYIHHSKLVEYGIMTSERSGDVLVDPVIYCDYYLLLEKVYKLYTDYERMYSKKLLSMKDDKIDRLEVKVDEQAKKMNEQSVKIDQLLAFGSEASMERSELRGEVANLNDDILDMKQHVSEIHDTLDIAHDELLDTKKTVNTIVELLDDKSLLSTMNPRDDSLVHYALVMIQKNGASRKVRFIAGQSNYVDSRKEHFLKLGFTVLFDKFYQAGPIDYRRNVQAALNDLIEETLAPLNAPIQKLRDELKIAIDKHNLKHQKDIPQWNLRVKERVDNHNITATGKDVVRLASSGKRYVGRSNRTFEFIRCYDDERRSFVGEIRASKYRLYTIPIKVSSTYVDWSPNKYISFEKLKALIGDINVKTQVSPYQSENGDE